MYVRISFSRAYAVRNNIARFTIISQPVIEIVVRRRVGDNEDAQNIGQSYRATNFTVPFYRGRKIF